MLCVKLIVEPQPKDFLNHHVLISCDELILDVHANPHMIMKTAGKAYNVNRSFAKNAKTRFFVTQDGKTVMSGHATFDKDGHLTDYAYDGHVARAA